MVCCNIPSTRETILERPTRDESSTPHKWARSVAAAAYWNALGVICAQEVRLGLAPDGMPKRSMMESRKWGDDRDGGVEIM
jgi:hypothetical protein